jgi:ligand-binding sensor domain-containing protein
VDQKGRTGSDNVRWLAETSDGSIWAAMKQGGLVRIDPVSGKIRLAGPKDGLRCDPQDVFVDRHDLLWLPTECGLFLNEHPSQRLRVPGADLRNHAGYRRHAAYAESPCTSMKLFKHPLNR